jgi:hypothetical protein
MRFSRIILLILLAALAFGGSFTCHYSSDGSHPTTQP